MRVIKIALTKNKTKIGITNNLMKSSRLKKLVNDLTYILKEKKKLDQNTFTPSSINTNKTNMNLLNITREVRRKTFFLFAL